MTGSAATMNATYGSHKTKCTLYVYVNRAGTWYVVDGSININCTSDDITPGCDIEELHDHSYMQANDPVESEEQLEKEVEE